MSAPALAPTTEMPRHSATVRVTHWITVLAFIALLITGAEIVISHPRFYWGETGNVLMKPLFTIPIPSSRGTVPTGYGYVMPDQNGWSRALHFQSAWVLVLVGLVYGIYGVMSGHFRRNLFPNAAHCKWSEVRSVISKHLQRGPADASDEWSYNVLQRTAYLSVIFIMFPLVIWTGLALSPAFNSAFPFAVNSLGGRQSARTIHFFASGSLVAFLMMHVVMVIVSGFRSRMRAMISGGARSPEGQS